MSVFKEGNKTKTFHSQAKQRVNKCFFEPHQEQETNCVACV